MANPNASPLAATPESRGGAKRAREAKSPAMCQILENTIAFDDSAKRQSVHSPEPAFTKDGIEPKVSHLDRSGACDKSALIGVLEQQARQVTQERDALIAEKAALRAEVEEAKATIGKVSAQIVERDRNHVGEMDEYDAYVEQMEDECCQLQVRNEKMDAYIEDLQEQLEELATENKLLKGQLSSLKKRKAEEAGVPKQVGSTAGSKRLRVAGSGDEDKENREHVTVRRTASRRSSCVFGIGVGKQ